MSERFIYNKAKRIGYVVDKRTMPDGISYNVKDLKSDCLVDGCYTSMRDHVWTLEEVERFIKFEYELAGMIY